MQSMNLEMMGGVEKIIKESFTRIIKISYAIGTKHYTSPGYVILYRVNKSEKNSVDQSEENPVNYLEKKLVTPKSPYIKICSMLDSERIPPKLSSNGMPPKRVPTSKINIKDIYWIEVLDYLNFPKNEHFPLSNIVEVCLKHDFNEPDITGLFTLDDKKNTEKSLRKIKKITDSKYPSFTFHDKNDLVVLKRFD
jgi:hypothetical protein